ncbi:RHS repeat-associated core domain-containing protein [Hydrogenophaga sp. T2]|uniref:RHS repeat-associated core domain-containing protein n=1 Tax=Hydrogenophaga sp. T2 TaxID=3132823 RepID=UPI003CF048CE
MSKKRKKYTPALLALSALAALSTSAAAQTPPPAMTWQYGYDAMGRLHTVVNPNAHSSHIIYDSLGRPQQSQQPPNEGTTTPTVIDLQHNGGDHLTQVTDPRGLATSYSRNGLGDVVSLVSPDTGTSSFTRDAKGNVLTRTDARGKTTTYTYDSLERLKTVSYPTGVGTVFEYDGGASPTAAALGELTKITDESGSTSYTHDALGRITAKTTVIGAKSFTVVYGWGDAGSALDKLTSITYPSGSRVNYAYDSHGDVSAISVSPVNANGVGTSGASLALLSAVAYNADRNLAGWLWSDGKARSIAYNAYGLISGYSLGDPQGTGNKAGVMRTLTRDAGGRITGYSHTNNATAQTALEQGFSYDKLNRLLSASLGGSSTQYSYDATGNRTSKTIGGNSYANTIAANSNRLTQSSDVNGTLSVSHDAVGNITAQGAQTLTYSDRGRLASVTNAGGTTTYLYNGLEQRASKSGGLVPTGKAHYVYDEAGRLLGEYDVNGVPLYETIYLNGYPVGVLKQAGSAANADLSVQLYNLHADHIATARLITRQDHTIVWRWDTAEAFGGTPADENPSGLGVFTYHPRFPGQVFDAESGLLQNWHRDYNARLGRYMQSDPIGLDGGINTYAYVGGDPVSNIDPRGEFFFVPMLAAAGWGALTDVALQLAANGGHFGCVNWKQVGVSAGIGALTGGAGSYLAKLQQLRAAKETSYLYRGVHAGHPALGAAKRGRVVPGNVNGTVSAEAHNLGGQAANSSMTSWTRDRAIAATHAAKNGPGGVVLRVPQGAPSRGAGWSWEWSPDVWGESEVLLRGVRTGVEVLK